MGIIVIASWFGAGAVAAVFSYGMTLAYFEHKFPGLGLDNRPIAWAMALVTFIAPPMVIQVYVMSRFAKHGLLFA